MERLEQTYTWTIAAATSIAWVIIAFAFTLVDSLMNVGNDVNTTGQGVGTLWLWLVPIVVGWLWTPVCSHERLNGAIDKANNFAFVAAPDDLPRISDPLNIDPPPRRAYDLSDRQAIRIFKKKKVFTQDASRAPPIFNYARIWEWHSAVEVIARAFESADRMARRRIPVNPRREWVHVGGKRSTNHRANRTGTVRQVQAYCGFPILGYQEPPQPIPSGVGKRIFVASVFALGLQWATTGSAAITVITTPTTGFGCRSGTYVLYGVISTMIWFTLMLSSYLAHCAKVRHARGDLPRPGFNSANLARSLATFLRRLSTFVAVCNTLCIILACVFQFSDVYSTCYCNSSVLGRGAKYAFDIIAPGYDYDGMRAAWIGGIALAAGYVVVFLFALHLMLEPSYNTINS